MSYAILRLKKIKSWGGIAGAVSHNLRLRETHNADTARTEKNQLIAGTTDPALGLKDLLKEHGLKPRKGAVLMSEMLLTASPEWFEKNPDRVGEWVEKNTEWLKRRYGKNLLQAVVHFDESTPHIHAFIAPVTADKKLNAKKFWGERKGLTELQSAYAHNMGGFGLLRGVPKSVGKHKTIRQFYQDANLREALPEMPRFPERPQVESDPELKMLLGGLKPEPTAQALRTWRSEIVAWAKKLREVLRKALTQNQALRAELASEQKRADTAQRRLTAISPLAPMWEAIQTHEPERVLKLWGQVRNYLPRSEAEAIERHANEQGTARTVQDHPPPHLNPKPPLERKIEPSTGGGGVPRAKPVRG